MRTVYHKSAKANKNMKSLNEALLRGPILLPLVCGMQLRFRSTKYVILDDIEKAFLHISLAPSDRDSTRFIWLKDSNKDVSMKNLEIYRFTRIAFDVISSPFLLGAVIRYYFTKILADTTRSEEEKRYAQMIIQNMYVDNLLGGVENLADAKALYEFAKQEFAKANMNLREWASNIPEFETYVDRKDLAVLKETTKILGIIWKPHSDTLVFSANNISVVPPYTKRKVLNQLASIMTHLDI